MKYDITKHSKQANEARNRKLTSRQRSDIAKRAAEVRWKNIHRCDSECYCECGRKTGNHINLHHDFNCKKNLRKK